MKKHLSKLIVLSLLAFLLVPLAIQAVTIENPLSSNTFQAFLEKIVDFLFVIAVGIAPIMILIAGFLFMSAKGEPEKIQTAKRMITWVIIGLIVISAAKGLIRLFRQVFGIN